MTVFGQSMLPIIKSGSTLTFVTQDSKQKLERSKQKTKTVDVRAYLILKLDE